MTYTVNPGLIPGTVLSKKDFGNDQNCDIIPYIGKAR